MITLGDVRAWALALPSVIEKPHFRLPGFRVAATLIELGWRHRAPKRLVAAYDNR
ncbi:hypothetical protein [Asanoa siamensis]|uniref:Uncharacterized protein n=1 Tax=Asanoa siamensis TaxID=926357 RepID=A0ABQ4CSS1_9ACTN|nr:hypothetical protein [Asanoa siamensis]GIF74335.1 hypothetical protein Asi02nite_38530 [Asanoa siamensis]